MIRWPRYDAHEGFVAPARDGAALWRLALGIVLAFVGYIALGQLFVETIWQLTQARDPAFVDRIFDGRSPGALLILLATFGFMTLAVGVTVRVLHRRSARSLLGALPLAIRQFATVLVALILLGIALFILPPWSIEGGVQLNMPVGLWVILLPVSLLAVLVQTSAEEIVFRGYLQQQLAARFASPLIWMGVPSALFALGHYVPEDAGNNAVAIALWAGLFGVLMADITARAGTLGPAIALHFFTNVQAILIVSMRGDLSGLALYLAPFGLEDTDVIAAWMPVDFAHMIVAWLVARLALRR